jgi:ubiquinone/menaquinone biosynthesis C-methylase UbiE
METYNSDLLEIEKFIQLDGKALLEVGCGDGRLTTFLADRAAAVTAIDPDGTKIEAAHRQFKGASFVVGSGENLLFAAGSFDIVLFSYSLHHQDCVRALAEANRVLRKDGKILVIEPAYESEFTLLVSAFEKDEVRRIRNTLTYLTSNTYKILCQDDYYVTYPYKDENELYKYFIANFMTKPDDHAVEKMESILGTKKTDRPIIIKDSVNIFLLGSD